MRVGFIGLGDQGGPMARAIAEAGWPLTVWARRAASLAVLAGVPHEVADDPTTLGQRCDLVGLCVRDDDDVRQLLVEGGLLAGLRPGSIVANHGTGSPDASGELAALAAESGVHVLDAPVSGGGQGARERTLTVMVGGLDDAVASCRPVFDTFARHVVHLGPSGSGQLAKLVNNALFAANLRNVAAVLDLASDLGVDADGLLALLAGSSGRSFALDALARPRTDDSLLHLQAMVAKDVGHLRATAARRGLAISALEDTAREGVEQVVAAGRGIAAGRA